METVAYVVVAIFGTLVIMALAFVLYLAYSHAQAALNRLITAMDTASDHTKDLPKLVEGLIRLCEEQVRQTQALKESVDRLHAAIFAGQGGAGFIPYNEADASEAFARHAARGGATGQPAQEGGMGTW
jgi:hypothetical protein